MAAPSLGAEPVPAPPSAATQPPARGAATPVYSELWGQMGERFDPAGRLPDFSFAGYREGKIPPPKPPVVANVRDFGARGDGTTDDTAAFLKALGSVTNGALLVPPGRYVITDILPIRQSNVVLRGTGPSHSMLVFPKGLEEVRPKRSATSSGEPTSAYSWGGGFISVEGKTGGPELGKLAVTSARGGRTLTLNADHKAQAGQWVELAQNDNGDKSLISHLYAGDIHDIAKINNCRTSFIARVASVDGERITLDRPLRTDANPAWNATLSLFAPTVTEVGIENLAFEFPSVPYKGHFKEDGRNALTFTGVANCWARNLRITNCDSGLFLNGRFLTVDGLLMDGNRPRDERNDAGHHGMVLGSDNLVRNFEVNTRFIHDVTVSHSSGSVLANGRGTDLCFDHHKRHPYANLFTNLDLGAGTRMFASGGGANLGLHAGAWTTFWNIRSARPQSWPTRAGKPWGPDLMNLVGVQSTLPSVTSATGRWMENVAPAQLEPRDLYQAQLERRVGAKNGGKNTGAAVPLSGGPY